MKRLIDAIIKKWFCCHKWELIIEDEVSCNGHKSYVMFHFVCKKCGKYKRVKSN